jgi:porin
LFLNPSHGIGPDFSQSGLAGPSIFPLTSLGVRGDYKFADEWIIRAAVLDAVPGHPDHPERTAVKLSQAEGALGVFELNYIDDRTRAALGYWRYTGQFEPFSMSSSAGEPAGPRGNDGVYAFVERELTRKADGGQGLAGWIRVGFADEQLNAVRRYTGAGLAYTGLLSRRAEDQIGVAVGIAQFGDPFRRSAALAGDPPAEHELIVEATYRAPVTRWLTLQPDIQYVVKPGGDRTVRDALILGLRAEVGF